MRRGGAMGEGELIDILDPEYAMPGEIERHVAGVMRRDACEPWPETAKRQIAELQEKVRYLEGLVHLMLNADDQER